MVNKTGVSFQSAILLIFVSAAMLVTSCSSMKDLGYHRIRRSLISENKDHTPDLSIGKPEENDLLLLNIEIVKDKRANRVVYADVIFTDLLYSDRFMYDCPYNITAIEVNHIGLEETAGFPLILYGGLGTSEVLILFISQRDEGLNFTLKIWGREYENKNKNYNLLEGDQTAADDLLLFTTVSQTGVQDVQVKSSVSYEKPDGKNVTITSVQAWDVSTGCKSGGYPAITEGGLANDNVIIQITSEQHKGFQYHVLVFGKTNSKVNKGEESIL